MNTHGTNFEVNDNLMLLFSKQWLLEHFILKCMSLALEMEFILVWKMVNIGWFGGTDISFLQFIWKFETICDGSNMFLTVERDFISIEVEIIHLDMDDWVTVAIVF